MKETKFKQTEVGMIPSDWDVCEIGSVCSIFGRIGFRGYTVLDLVDEGCGAITLSPSNIKNNRMDYSKYTEISWKKYEESPEIKIFNGDILLVKTGSTFGKSALVENLPHEATINPQFVVLKKIQISNAYLNYVIADTVVQKQIQETIVGGAIPTLSQKQIAGFNIPLPSSTEQQRIANALSDVDTLIANLEKLIAKKKNIKQGAMQQLLTGKKRLPGFGSDERTGSRPTDERRKECHSERSAKREESSGYKMTELGLIPSDWEVKTFGELFDMCTANIPIKDVNQEFYVGTENMLQNKMGVVKNTAVLPYSKVREYQKNDILVSNIRPYLKKIWFADKNGGCSTDVLVFRVKDKNQSPSFLYNVVADDRFFNIVNENAIGTKMPRGDKNVIKQILFAVPSSKAEQTAIANILSDMDAEIATLETKLAKYRKLKTGMMQQLLTGKIRLV